MMNMKLKFTYYRMLHKFFTKNKCLGSIIIILFHVARISKTKFEVRGGNDRGIGRPYETKQIGRLLLDR